jgi:hypothetical protein
MEPALQALTLLRLLAFMVVLYLALGWLVERIVQRPESRLKGFFRLLCSPVTRPVSRLLAPGAAHARVLAVSLGVVGGLWVVLVAASEALRR